MGSQVVAEDRSRVPGRGTVGEVRRGGRARAEGRKEYTDLGERKKVACHASALAMTDEACREAKM